MKALILIGGEGTRLRPLTINSLKCMAPIANRPFIEYQINLLKKYGIKDIVLSVCHMPEKVKKILGSGKKYGVKLQYADEKKPLGTGGAIKNCEELLDGSTVVMNGDVLTDIKLDSMIKAHKTSGAVVTIALHEVKDPSMYGLVEIRGKDRIFRFTEKPSGNDIKSGWINAGIYIFDKKALSYIVPNKNISVERETFPAIIASNDFMQAYKADYYWLDIGRIDKYMEANFDVVEGKLSGIKVKPCKIKGMAGKSMADRRSVIGRSVKIGNDVIIENSVIQDEVTIKDKSIIKNSVICRGCIINENCTVVNTVLGDNSILTKYTKYGV